MLIAMSLNICAARGDEDRMIGRLAAAGFDGLDFNFCDMLQRIDWSSPAAVDALLRPWEEAAAQHGMPWLQGHGPMFHMFGSTPADAHARGLSKAAIAAAGRLGVPWLVFHPDVFAGAWDAAHRKAVLAANVEFFRSLLPACEESGVGIAIENLADVHARNAPRRCPRFFGGMPEELCALVDTLDNTHFGICWDTGHAHMNALDQRASIAALGPRLKALHIQENDGTRDDHMLPFATARGVNWTDVGLGLRDVRYGGAFTYEAHNGLRSVPDALLDDHLILAARTARHIAGLAAT